MKEINRRIIPIVVSYVSPIMPFFISSNSTYSLSILKKLLVKLYGESIKLTSGKLPKGKIYNRKKYIQYPIPIIEIWDKKEKIIYYSRSLLDVWDYNIEISLIMWNNSNKVIEPYNLIINLISYLPDNFGIIYLKNLGNDKCNNVYTKNYLPKKDIDLL